MFTNLNFLQVGKKWVPNNTTYRKRQDNYIVGRLAYEGEIEEIYKDVWQTIATRYGASYSDMQQVMIKVNFFKALTDTFELLAFRDEPDIWIGKKGDFKRLEDEEIIAKDDLIKLMKQAFISAHAQGDNVIKVYSKNDGTIDIAIVNAENWIPVKNPNNLKEIDCHVVAQTYEVDNSTTFLGKHIDNVETFLDVEIHHRGYYDKRLYKLDKNNIIQKLINEEKDIQTGYDDFLIFPFNYGAPAWRDWGKSAYQDIVPLVDEIIVRLSNNSKILDEHSDPQPIIPREALDFDNRTGEWVYQRHKALTLGKDGQKPSYLTWDGQLESSEKQLDRIMTLFFMLTGTNPQLFGQDIAGNLSGEALAKIFLVAIGKTKEMVLALENAFQKALDCILKIKGKDLISDIKFDVGQFNTETDISNRIVSEKNAGITSLKRAIEEINPRYSQEEVKKELKQIHEDKKNDSMTDISDLFPNDKDDLDE